ncbi:MAG: hypothetical protein QOC95_853, partial [Thermoleophilaceae bacterium]|nr:hypothetical protein [Thermoleophilaceae bacterium]
RVGASVCTEGIETLEELRCLLNLGVTYGQGYLLGRPSDPWVEVSPEIARALATGALRSHAPPPRSSQLRGVAPQPGPFVQPHDVGSAQYIRHPSSPIAGPVNRRLNRY